VTRKLQPAIRIPVAISARHVHLTRNSIDALFGPDYQLRVRTPLSQPGQFAAEETVTLAGPQGTLTKVRIVGPERREDQVELSRTDEIELGLDAPLRASGDLTRTPGLRIIGPKGWKDLECGVILAQRHIHMSPADADCLGLRDGELVQVGLEHTGRALTFGDVIVRVSPEYRLEMHLDTDEGNAAGLHHGEEALLTLTAAFAHIHTRRRKLSR
jgi:acetate kinase